MAVAFFMAAATYAAWRLTVHPSRAAWTGFLHAAREIAERGSFTSLGRAIPFAEINGLFARK